MDSDIFSLWLKNKHSMQNSMKKKQCIIIVIFRGLLVSYSSVSEAKLRLCMHQMANQKTMHVCIRICTTVSGWSSLVEAEAIHFQKSCSREWWSGNSVHKYRYQQILPPKYRNWSSFLVWAPKDTKSMNNLHQSDQYSAMEDLGECIAIFFSSFFFGMFFYHVITPLHYFHHVFINSNIFSSHPHVFDPLFKLNSIA